MKTQTELVPQIAQSFQWVTEEFREKHNKWLDEFWHREFPSVFNAYDKPLETVQNKKTERHLTYKHNGKQYNTLSELLEHLDEITTVLDISDDKKMSWLRKTDISAARKLGVHIPVPWLLEAKIDRIQFPTKYPTIFCIGFPNELNSTKKDAVHHKLMIGIRQDKLPNGVEQFAGIPYLFGFCYDSQDKGGKNLWVGMYIVISPSGDLFIPRMKQSVPVKIHTKRKMGKYRGGRETVITQTMSVDQQLLYDDIHDKEYIEHWMKVEFANCFKWWNSRSERWNVSVKKNKHKMTFSVGGNDTKYFFSGRDKTIKAADGKAKRIAHYVRPHTRITGETVKDHVRGIRDFSWNGYTCRITAPVFHSVLSSEFDLKPVHFDEKPDKNLWMKTSKVANLLSRLEEQ